VHIQAPLLHKRIQRFDHGLGELMQEPPQFLPPCAGLEAVLGLLPRPCCRGLDRLAVTRKPVRKRLPVIARGPPGLQG